jgi:TolA-binding protein
MKSIFFFLFIVVALYSKEVSVFGAGDLESSAPYGLTKSEKVILKNKKELNRFDQKIGIIRSDVSDISERVDGLESVVDGNSLKIQKHSKSLDNKTKEIEVLKSDILFLKEEIQIITQKQKDIQDSLDSSNQAFNKLVVEVEKNYVTKKEFNKLVKFINKQVDEAKKEKLAIQKRREAEKRKAALQRKKALQKEKAKKKLTKKKSKKELLADAKHYFKKDYFKKAKPIFEFLVESNYRPAESSFYLGEILFYKKDYKGAIGYYKKSMMLYDKAKYIPRLLLHSAISFEKTSDKTNAVNFYGTLIDIYPKTKEAQDAKKRLTKLEKKGKNDTKSYRN